MRLMFRAAVAALACVALASCAPRRPATEAQPRYVVGSPYQMGGVWSYPREDFALDQTGIASVIADPRAGRRTANGEIYDPAILSAAHRTLQMPAIVAVTNLDSGLRLEVRLNDRGPDSPGRVIGLSRRAAQLLGIAPNGVARVRVEVLGEPSRAFSGGLPTTEAAPLEIAAAPLGAVQTESLAPPPGATQATRLRQARSFPGAAGSGEAVSANTGSAPPLRLPERLTRVSAAPGQLWVEAATFSRRDMADRQAARLYGLGARVQALGGRGRGSQPTYRVRLGPFQTVPEADRALEGTLRAGVSEARILVD